MQCKPVNANTMALSKSLMNVFIYNKSLFKCIMAIFSSMENHYYNYKHRWFTINRLCMAI